MVQRYDKSLKPPNNSGKNAACLLYDSGGGSRHVLCVALPPLPISFNYYDSRFTHPEQIDLLIKQINDYLQAWMRTFDNDCYIIFFTFVFNQLRPGIKVLLFPICIKPSEKQP